jgi:uncharacterized protein (TIGR00251 family)
LKTVPEYSHHNGKIGLRVQVVPRASRTELAGEQNGALRVRIASAPVDGAANEELIRILAKTYKVSRSAVIIVRGHKSRLKYVEIEGAQLSDEL